MRNKKYGFTLAELLIVVAIIAVLVGVSIPVFASQLEKSREAADTANIRALYSEVMTEAISTGKDVNTDAGRKVTLKQTTDDWQNEAFQKSLEVLGSLSGVPSKGGSAWVSFAADGELVTISFDGGGGSGGSGGSGGGTPYTAGTPVQWKSGSELQGNSKLNIDIPADAVTINNTMTIYIHKNPGQGHGQSETVPITLTRGEPVNKIIDIDVKHNGSIDISFSEDVDEDVAQALLSYFSLT